MEKRTRQYLRATRATHVVDFRANADNIRQICPKDMNQFWYSIACSQCSRVQTPVRIAYSEPQEDAPIARLDWAASCTECRKELRFAYIESYIEKKYTDYGIWNPLFLCECQGCRLDIVGCDIWMVKSISDTVYEWDSHTDFFHYDEMLGKPIGISELDFNVRTLL